MPDKHPNTERWGGPGASHEDRTEPRPDPLVKDADPELEVVIGTSHSGVVVFQIPGSANARILWGTARGNLLRNGQAPVAPPSLAGVLFRSGFE